MRSQSDAVRRGPPLSRPFTYQLHVYIPPPDPKRTHPQLGPASLAASARLIGSTLCLDHPATRLTVSASLPRTAYPRSAAYTHACMNSAPHMLQPPLKLPGWSRRLLLAALALSACTTCFVRVLTAPTALHPLQARNIRQPRWTVAGLPLRMRKTRVAVLHQGDASSDGMLLAVAVPAPARASLQADADAHHLGIDLNPEQTPSSPSHTISHTSPMSSSPSSTAHSRTGMTRPSRASGKAGTASLRTTQIRLQGSVCVRSVWHVCGCAPRD